MMLHCAGIISFKSSHTQFGFISERRIHKFTDPATNDGLPAFLVTNLDGSESGFMIVQYTAAALVNNLALKGPPYNRI